MKLIEFNQIDSTILEISCCNGVAENVEISNIPLALHEKITNLQIADGLVVPEKFRNHFSVVCNHIECGNREMSLQLQIRFLSCAALCTELKQSFFNFIFFDKILRIKFVCSHTAEKIKESMLAIDLGNTRTCAVVCPDINSLDMVKLTLEPHYSTDSVQTTHGVWNSVCILGKTEAFKDVSTSFVRVGKEYDDYFRNGTDHNANMLRSLSTPKRYFWDDETDREWSITQPKSDRGLDLKYQQDVELAKVISDNSFNGKYPRAMMLEGIIYELLEQADRMLNKHKYFGNDSDDREVRAWHNDYYYLLKHLVVTFPAAWSYAEVEEYKRVIQRSVDYFVSQRCGASPIQLHMDCNEATAVLVNYIYSEANRFGSGEKWLKLMGKKDPHPANSRSLRVGVIDIGGGTSDLAIAEVAWDPINHATKITTCYTYGTNEAGDTMIAKIVRDFIFDKVFNTMIADTASAANKQKIKEFVVQKVLPTQQALARSFWFPLAVRYLEEAEKNPDGEITIKIFDQKQANARFNSGFAALKRKIEEMLESASDDSFKNLSLYIKRPDQDATANKDVEIGFSSKDHAIYRKLLEENFRFSPMTFGAALSAFQCNMVVWSGKTSENRDIRRLFEEQIPVPFSSFVSMNDYTIQADFPLTGLDGKLSDSKYATAIGAALYAWLRIRQDLHFPLAVHDEDDFRSSYWGVVDAIGNFKSYLSPDQAAGVENLTYNGNQLLIYRANSDSPLTSAMPAYEFRSKPEANIKINGGMNFILRQTAGDLDFELTGGNFNLPDGTPLNAHSPNAKKYFELRIRMIGEEEIWLDTGKIF